MVDAGPLVAALNRRDEHHGWAVAEMADLQGPAITCEAALTEASFLVERDGGDPALVLDLVRARALDVRAVVAGETERVADLMRQYAHVRCRSPTLAS